MNETLTRTFTLDRAKAKGDTFPAVATTEAPVRRHFGYEVLDMSRMDLSRAPLPVIESHDQSKLNIGLFENVHIDGDKLRGTIRLGKSARAREVAEDIREGIVRSVSVGYEAFDPIEDGEIDDEPVYRFASRIHELSLVAAPADPNAGIYRSKGTTTMETEKQYTDEELRTESIRQAAERFDLQELGCRAIDEKWSVQRFNDAALEVVASRNERRRETPPAEPRRDRAVAPGEPGGERALRQRHHIGPAGRRLEGGGRGDRTLAEGELERERLLGRALVQGQGEERLAPEAEGGEARDVARA